MHSAIEVQPVASMGSPVHPGCWPAQVIGDDDCHIQTTCPPPAPPPRPPPPPPPPPKALPPPPAGQCCSNKGIHFKIWCADGTLYDKGATKKWSDPKPPYALPSKDYLSSRKPDKLGKCSYIDFGPSTPPSVKALLGPALHEAAFACLAGRLAAGAPFAARPRSCVTSVMAACSAWSGCLAGVGQSGQCSMYCRLDGRPPCCLALTACCAYCGCLAAVGQSGQRSTHCHFAGRPPALWLMCNCLLLCALSRI